MGALTALAESSSTAANSITFNSPITNDPSGALTTDREVREIEGEINTVMGNPNLSPDAKEALIAPKFRTNCKSKNKSAC